MMRTVQSAEGVIRKRKNKLCRICKRTCNEDDHVTPGRLMRWQRQKSRPQIDVETGLEILKGKVDFYCQKAFLNNMSRAD